VGEYVFGFEKLKAWQLARDFAVCIYEVTHTFPPDEKFGLISQLRRASVSIASNLAEGSARQSLKHQAHFSQLAYSSLVEVVCQLEIALELGFMTSDQHKQMRNQANELSYMINALQRSQKNQ
jgi:four helix bundle protein